MRTAIAVTWRVVCAEGEQAGAGKRRPLDRGRACYEHRGETYRPVSSDAGKYLRVVAMYADGFGTENDKAYARTAHPVADAAC